MCHHCFLFLFAFFIALKNLKTTLSLQFDVNTDHRWDRGPGLYFDNPCYNLSPYGIILLIYEVGIVGLSRKRAGHMSDLYLWCLVQDLAYCRASIHFCWENEWMNEWIFFRGWWTWAWIPRFQPWVGKILWKMEWLPTPLFLPGEFHKQRSLVGYKSMGLQRVRHH